MVCTICGSRGEYRDRSRLVLCEACHEKTPEKVSKKDFEKQYFGSSVDQVPEAVKRSFYEDYKVSTCGPVAEYLNATSELSASLDR